MANSVESALKEFRAGLAGRERSRINRAAADLIELRAPLGAQWQSVSLALQRNGEWTLAIQAIDRMRADLRFDAVSGYAYANVLYQAGRFADALHQIDALEAKGQGPSTAAHKVSILNSRVSMLLLLGRIDEARERLSEALTIEPRSGQAWMSLSEIARFHDRDAAEVAPLETAYAAGPSIASEGLKLAHACGRCRHQLQNYEGAFEAFAKGAEIVLSSPAANAKGSSRLVEQSTSFSGDLIRDVSRRITEPHDRVIFVSGLPRSGTTLVEQIVASHPDVQHGEELGFFRILGQELGGIEARDLVAWLDRGGDPNDLVRLYLHLADERFGPKGRFVDKTIEAGNYMGLLLALFPQAPVFWMRRDPFDSGWSAFRTAFARGATWSWNLGDIGRRLAQEDAMARHWSQTVGERINFIDYEALVRDPEPHIRAIAAAAGLQATEQMFRPHETRRSVASASVTQVREPINLKGLGVAEPYRPWLGPLIDAYQQASVSECSADRG